MASSKISSLTPIANSELHADDLFNVVDISATKNKKILVSELDTRWMRFADRVKNENSLVSNSDQHVPTQSSVKSYVDSTRSDLEADDAALDERIDDSNDRLSLAETTIADLLNSLPTTGDVRLTFKSVAPAGWVMMNDGTIGNAASGATARANDDTAALFILLWNGVSDTNCPVSGGRGASASADFAAGKTLTLAKALGRALGVAGSGLSLTSRALGSTVGAEEHVLSEAEMPSHTHSQLAHTHVQNAHSHPVQYGNNSGSAARFNAPGIDSQVSGTGNPTYFSAIAQTATNQNTTAVNQNTGGGSAHNNMQPTTFVNAMIKL